MSVMLMSFDGFMAQLKNHALLISIFVPNAIKSRQLLVEISAKPLFNLFTTKLTKQSALMAHIAGLSKLRSLAEPPGLKLT